MPALRRRSTRAAVTLAAAALLASGCAQATEVTRGVESAANTAEVCGKSTAAVTSAFARIGTAASAASQGRLNEAQQTVTAELDALHQRLQPLADKALDTDVKAALERLDTQVTTWAENPAAFLRGGEQRVDTLVTDLKNACTPA
jgi:hypothetical protein